MMILVQVVRTAKTAAQRWLGRTFGGVGFVEHAKATRPRYRVIDFAPLVLLGLSSVAKGQVIETIYTKIPLHPTAQVPGPVDLGGSPAISEWKAIESLAISPGGSRWMLRGRTNLGADLEQIAVIGSGRSGSLFVQEGQRTPGGGETRFDSFGSDASPTQTPFGRFDDAGRFAFSARTRDGATGSTEGPSAARIFRWDGSALAVVGRIDDSYSGCFDRASGGGADGPGNEAMGGTIGGVHLLNNGTVGYSDATILHVGTDLRPGLFYDRTLFHQSGGVDTVINLEGTGVNTLAPSVGVSTEGFRTTPDGAHSMFIGTIAGTPTRSVLVRDGRVIIQSGLLLSGTAPGSEISVHDGIGATSANTDGNPGLPTQVAPDHLTMSFPVAEVVAPATGIISILQVVGYDSQTNAHSYNWAYEINVWDSWAALETSRISGNVTHVVFDGNTPRTVFGTAPQNAQGPNTFLYTFDLSPYHVPVAEGRMYLVGFAVSTAVGADGSFKASTTSIPGTVDYVVNSTTILPASLIGSGRWAMALTESPATIGAVSSFELLPNGHWFAWGTFAQIPGFWAVRDGVVVARTGDPVTGTSTEHWGNSIVAVTGNRRGDWVINAATDGPSSSNEVILLNGTTVLAREGGQVDLNNDQVNQDDAFLGHGTSSLPCFLEGMGVSDDGYVYFLSNIRSGAGVDWNGTSSFGDPNGLFRVAFAPSVGPCGSADFNGDGDLGTDADIAAFFSCLGGSCCPTCGSADFNGDGDLGTDADIESFFRVLGGGSC